MGSSYVNRNLLTGATETEPKDWAFGEPKACPRCLYSKAMISGRTVGEPIWRSLRTHRIEGPTFAFLNALCVAFEKYDRLRPALF